MIRWFASGAVALGCLGIWTQQSEPQDPNSTAPASALAATSPIAPAAPVDQAFGQATAVYGTEPGAFTIQTVNGQDVMVYRQLHNQYHEALGKYRSAKVGSEERDAARGEISKLLSEQYDGFMQQHEQQIADLEERLAKLKEQLQRRREAKSRMVELKLEMVLSQADGLGWPEGGDAWFTPYFGQTAPGALPAAGLPVNSYRAPNGYTPARVQGGTSDLSGPNASRYPSDQNPRVNTIETVPSRGDAPASSGK